MMDILERHCRARGIERILGVYLPTPKNGMVAELYGQLGFHKVSEDPTGATVWHFEMPERPTTRNRSIKVFD
jgi:predicted enzyme involved in methoxymalonyl-ACP biosynthesis